MKALTNALLAAALVAGGCPAGAADMQPSYHFGPARNWMNDPNGLVYLDGEYHLFFQYNPYGDRWGHMNWGHAVSRDLMTWRELPVAIPETADVMAFSGSAVVDWNNTSGFGQGGKPPLVAIYTGHNPKAKLQSQYAAYSNDRGRTWTVHGEVLSVGSAEFRDPKVFWHEPTKRWVMISVLALENRAMIFTSPDLKRWTYASSFGPAGGRGKNWECPDLFELPVEGGAPGEKRWVLTINLGDNAVAGGSGGQYFVGDFDGSRFVPVAGWGPEPQWLDYGADFYAAVSYNDLPKDDHRRILVGWANNWNYAEQIPTYPSRGLMTVPRVATLSRTRDGYRLAQNPVRELELRRERPSEQRDIVVGDKPVALPVSGGSSEMEINLDAKTAHQVILTLADGAGHETLIGVNPGVNEVFLDRTRSGEHFFDGFEARHVTPVDLSSGKVTLRILFDQSIIELFINDGTRTITDRIFPTGKSFRWSASAVGGPATIQLKSWVIKNSR